jgi:ubiquinone biosynthesis UbiH/UbiF/VisC/COQ6 family hydroxylase
MSTPRIVVAGGGMVGATVASLLARTGMDVHLVDRRGPVTWEAQEPVGLRVSALSPGSEAILDAAGAWAGVQAGRHCVYRRMHVEDGQGRGSIDFEAARFGLSHLGTLVENDLVSASLWEACTAAVRLDSHTPDRVVALDTRVDGIRVELESGAMLEADLLVACDGARSELRRIVGIDSDSWEYNQRGLVAQVRKSQPNPGVAWQRFLGGGPLAFLPLADGTSSIVWSLPTRIAEERLADDPDQFREHLQEASEGWLGTVESVGPRAAFPLAMTLGDRFVSGRVVLLGDAAHAIHPLAGQGVNLGLADAAGLVECLVESGMPVTRSDWASRLRRFERWRRSESTLMAGGIHALGTLFRPGALAPLRGAGMGLLGRSWFAREALLRRAAGQGPNAPRLALGKGLEVRA